jgi:hypothetical protein
MVGRLGRAAFLLAMLVAVSTAPLGCGQSTPTSTDQPASGRSGTSGASGGPVVVGSGGGSVGGRGSGGAAGTPTSTCAVAGAADTEGGNDAGEAGAGSAPACGLIVYVTSVYGPDCQAWMEANCCPLLEACAGSRVCKTLVDCINACNPSTASCVGCCTRGLTDEPPELDAIASCTKSGAVMPDGCAWPPNGRR